jgi:4-hydroxy-tetrahydrodipicolinate synthase
MSGPIFKGSIPALITPFANGRVDEQAFQDFVEWQIEQGSNGLVPCGTTGESPTLSHEEDMRVASLCVEVARGRVPVIAGTGSNSTDEAIALTRHAKEAGADAVLVVAPYYNKPTQEGLYQHYKAIHDAVEIPIVVYNVPGRTSVKVSPETMARLAELPQIVGIKDATADLTYMADTRMLVGDDFTYLSGEDPTVVPYLALGGHGCISVTANVAPRLCAELHEAWQKGDVATVRAIDDRLMPLHRALFVETNPAPVKYAASLLGKCENRVRLPLVTVSADAETRIREAMAHAGLIN